MPRAGAEETSLKEASPSTSATPVPKTKPISTARVPRKPEEKRCTKMMTASVPKP